MCLVKIFFGASPDFIKFRVQSSDLGIQFDEVQARRRNQAVGFDPGVILAALGFQVYARRRLTSGRITLQVCKIKA